MNLSWILSAKDIFVCAPCVNITQVIYLSVACSRSCPPPANLHKGMAFPHSPAPPVGMPQLQLQELDPLHRSAGRRGWEKELLEVWSCSKTGDFSWAYNHWPSFSSICGASGEVANTFTTISEAAWIWSLSKVCPTNKETETSVHFKILETSHREE